MGNSARSAAGIIEALKRNTGGPLTLTECPEIPASGWSLCHARSLAPETGSSHPLSCRLPKRGRRYLLRSLKNADTSLNLLPAPSRPGSSKSPPLQNISQIPSFSLCIRRCVYHPETRLGASDSPLGSLSESACRSDAGKAVPVSCVGRERSRLTSPLVLRTIEWYDGVFQGILSRRSTAQRRTPVR